jgi:hypothetical protein
MRNAGSQHEGNRVTLLCKNTRRHSRIGNHLVIEVAIRTIAVGIRYFCNFSGLGETRDSTHTALLIPLRATRKNINTQYQNKIQTQVDCIVSHIRS